MPSEQHRQRGGVPTQKQTTITPDEPDVLDVGEGVEGLGADGLGSGLSFVSGCVGVFLVMT